MEIPAVELSQLNLPAFLSISKVSVLEHENKKKKNRKDKKKKEPQVCISVIRFYYRLNGVEKVMCKETKFTGVKSDILPTIQSMVDAIKPPIIMSTDEFNIPNEKRLRSFSRTSLAAGDTKRVCRGGSRTGAGRTPNKLKTSKKKIVRSLKKNKQYAKAKRRVRYEREKLKNLHTKMANLNSKIFALEEALEGKNSVASMLRGGKKWAELTEFQQNRLFRQCTAVLHLLKLHRKFTFNARRPYANNIYKMVCALCPFQQ